MKVDTNDTTCVYILLNDQIYWKQNLHSMYI